MGKRSAWGTILLLFAGSFGVSCAFLLNPPSALPKRILAAHSSTDTVVEKTVVVVGGGWAGFSAADAVARSCNRTKVILLDASSRGVGGLSGGWRTPNLGLPIEAGIHGFWREYRNTLSTIDRIGLNESDVLTPFIPSTLVSQNGRVAVAPVLGETEEAAVSDLPGGLENLIKNLPAPLGIALLAKYEKESPLTMADRLSGLGLLGPWCDFGQESEDSWKAYDKISADNLFRNIAGISPTLYDELVAPLLHVLPMTPAYDCSAAAALSCFHVFALQTPGAFDVKWCRGSISELIFNPWVEQLTQRNVEIRGSSKVSSIVKATDGTFEIGIVGEDETPLVCDSVILGIGATSAGRLVDTCPPLQSIPGLKSKWENLRGITCVAVRLFFSSTPREVYDQMEDSPVVVCGPNILPELVETGFCIYDLNRLQDEFGNNKEVKAFEVDFFRADLIAGMSDDQVVDMSIRAIEKAIKVPTISRGLLLDSAVVRARNAVSHFGIGSAEISPPVRLDKGLYTCGDWVDRTGHASWSTEKAVVTGLQAAEACVQDLGISYSGPSVIPAAPDSVQLGQLRELAKAARSISPSGAFPSSPWALLNQLLAHSR